MRIDSGKLPVRLSRRVTGSSLTSLRETDGDTLEADAGDLASEPGQRSGIREPGGADATMGSSAALQTAAPSRTPLLKAPHLHRMTPMPGDVARAERPPPRNSQRLVNSLPSLTEAEYDAAVAGELHANPVDQPPGSRSGAEALSRVGYASGSELGSAASLHRVTPRPAEAATPPARASRVSSLTSMPEAQVAAAADPTPNPGGEPAGGQLTAGRLAAPALQRLTPMPDAGLSPSMRSQQGSQRGAGSLPSLSEAGSEQDEAAAPLSGVTSAGVGATSAEHSVSGSFNLQRVTPIPTDQSGTLYHRGRRADSGLLTLSETLNETLGELGVSDEAAKQPGEGSSSGAASRVSDAGPSNGAAEGPPNHTAAGKPEQAAEAGRGTSEGRASGGVPWAHASEPGDAETGVGSASGLGPPTAAAGAFWLSAAAAAPESGGVASHRVELSGVFFVFHLQGLSLNRNPVPPS